MKKEFEATVNTKELAKRLSVSVEFIEKARREMKLPFYKLGGICRYRLSEVETWLQQRKAG